MSGTVTTTESDLVTSSTTPAATSTGDSRSDNEQQFGDLAIAMAKLSELRARNMADTKGWDDVNDLIDEVHGRIEDSKCVGDGYLGGLGRLGCKYSTVECALDLACPPIGLPLFPPSPA